MTHAWDPSTYLAYADERGRPFLDLLARVHASEPQRVVDLGCGPGTLTGLLARRWPGAEVVGVDSSAEMVAAAEGAAERAAGVRYVAGDLRSWRPDGPVDVLVTNATLQWVPGHLDLLPDLLGHVAPGGWFALQVPGNFGEPSHTRRHELEADPRFAPHLSGVEGPRAHDPEVYLERLLALGCSVDVWETTYLHLLTGSDAVFHWAVGTGARPTLQALPGELRHEFEDEFRRALRSAYPPGEHGTVLPFRRVFAVAQKAPGRHPA
ncbi:MAG: Trans-aconitate 2-methyltransferase [uncultured Nocardioidaceae bacterium]|uniref:Trans-aconitate 2-methyltransferase n=1 Tax=uncultured Nocardioidaceae bacterium TaxID=253824 RepID=A0A6J4LEA8_9ACTN|nr:MAG: Trans-aconitate 2-methyltransferase [uncultured Nocardioidaceae bacterium]